MDFNVSDFNVDRTLPAGAIPLYYHAPFYADLLRCEECTCRKEAKRVIPGDGPKNAEILFLGRNPGGQEDDCGLPFIHEAPGGAELDAWLIALGLARERVIITNTVKCHTYKDRPPSNKEIMICTETWFKKEIEWLSQIKLMFTLGNQATEFVLGGDAESTASMRPYWVTVKFGERQLVVMPLAHPGYLVRKRYLIPQMHTAVLPRIREYIEKEFPDVYARARIQNN